MHLMYFVEQADRTYKTSDGDRIGYTVLLYPNELFDAVEGSQQYQERLEQYKFVEQMGYDGVMLNEHHNAPFCMQTKINIWATAVAAVTERVKIVLLGNPLPLSDDPVRLAEELMMIDLMSKGRLVSGFVRGGGPEQIATNANPAFNRERFVEAHDLIVKAWTQDGPWRWEGDHYHSRLVNPWLRPLQKPHPRIWIPGISSPETVVWAAHHRYPYIALNLPIPVVQKVWEMYDDAAQEVGYESGPEYRGYLIQCTVAETDEEAVRIARNFSWMRGEFTGFFHPVWGSPSGYQGEWARRETAQMRVGRLKRPMPTFEERLASENIIAGSPDTVVKQLRKLLEQTRPSILALWPTDGWATHEETMRSIRLTGEHVLPQIREIGRELGLDSPFEKNTPVSLATTDPKALRPLPLDPAKSREAWPSIHSAEVKS